MKYLIPLVLLMIVGCTTVQHTGNAVKDVGNDVPKASTSKPSTNPSPASTTTYSLQEVAKHNNEDSCWLAIHGKVYDVTEFIPGHPGGKAILEGCGKDASDLYETRPMGSGTPHSSRAREMLDNYYIGDLE